MATVQNSHRARLYLDHQLADTDNASQILLTWEAEDLLNSSAIKNSWSKTVTLQATKTNRRIFDGACDTQRVVYDTGIRRPFVLVGYHGQVIEQGYFKLNSVKMRGNRDVTSYSITLYGELGAVLMCLQSEASGNELTLGDLHYFDDEQQSLGFTISAAEVTSRWESLNAATTVKSPTEAWQILNFAPCYNGVPDNENFDADKCLIIPSNLKIDTTYSKDGNSYSTINGYSIATLSKACDEWEMQDLRCWQQRPVLNIEAFLAACGRWIGAAHGAAFDYSRFTANTQALHNKGLWVTLPQLQNLGIEYSAETTTVDVEGTFSGSASYGLTPTAAVGVVACGGLSWMPTDPSDISAFTSTGNAYVLQASGSFSGAFYGTVGDIYMIYGFAVALYYEYKYDNAGRIISDFLPVGGTRLEELTFFMPSGANSSATSAAFSAVRDECRALIKAETGSLPTFGDTTATFTASGNVITFADQSSSYLANKVEALKACVIPWRTTHTRSDTTHVETTLVGVAGAVGQIISGTSVTLPSITISLDFSQTGTYAYTGFTMTSVSQRKLLNVGVTPCDLLTSLCKTLGYALRYDIDTATLEMLNRDELYSDGDVLDITGRVDVGDASEVTPFVYESRYLEFSAETDGGEYIGKYDETASVEFGVQRVDTGFQFDTETENVWDGTCLRRACPAQQKDSLYFYARLTPDYTAPIFCFAGNKYTLWKGGDLDESTDVDMPAIASFSGCLNTSYNYYDYADAVRMQFRDADNKPLDGSLVLVACLQQTNTGSFFVSEDTGVFETINGGKSCWISRDTGLGQTVTKLPNFCSVNFYNYAAEADYQAATPLSYPLTAAYSVGTGKDIWTRRMAAYYTDRYSSFAHKVTVKMRTQGLVKSGREMLCRFVWWNGATWVVNKVQDWDAEGGGLCKVELIRVADMANYNGQEEM